MLGTTRDASLTRLPTKTSIPSKSSEARLYRGVRVRQKQIQLELMTKAWVYILRCADGSYYTGYTTDLEKRIAEHQAGEGSDWTRRRLPVELVFSQEMPNKDYAFLAE